MNRKKCVIIVPIYKIECDFDEYNSLKQLFKILPSEKYDIICIHPKSLNLSYYINNFNFSDYYMFYDEYFENYPFGYNSLMLNSGFYEMFLNYEFMLIYQPDCWIFRDELEYWCNKNYDYIGSPIYMSNNFSYLSVKTFIGNGGLSLRNISTMYHLCKDYSFFIQKILKNNKKNDLNNVQGEDLIFMYILTSNIKHNFKLPSFYEALQFSFECNPYISYQVLDQKLPFGCHAYKKVIGHNFWDDFICYDKKRYSVVTFLFGDYDILRDPIVVDETAEYICITDNDNLKSNVWEFKHITDYDISSYSNWQKSLIARYTALNYITTDKCIIVDASIRIKRPLGNLINSVDDSEVGFIIHPYRDSYLDELDEWINVRYLDPQQKEDFIDFCNKNNFNVNAKGIIAPGVMFMRKTENVTKMNAHILKELMNNYNFSIRVDQIYLSVIFFHCYWHIIRTYFSLQILESDYFTWYHHGTNNTHINDYIVDLSKPEIRNVFGENVLCKYL